MHLYDHYGSPTASFVVDSSFLSEAFLNAVSSKKQCKKKKNEYYLSTLIFLTNGQFMITIFSSIYVS